jgi:hypothetical protein
MLEPVIRKNIRLLRVRCVQPIGKIMRKNSE